MTTPSVAQSYRLSATRVEVTTQAHWQAWERPPGVADVAATGMVTPAYVDTTANAVADAASFSYPISGSVRSQYGTAYDQGTAVMARGGVKRCGSGGGSAGQAIDQDSVTAWEPDSADPLDTWWLEIDLGRLVSATRIVVRFAADSPDRRADPFLQFRVHSSAGQSPFGSSDQSGALDYELVGGTTRPNKDQRVFSFDLTPVGPYSPGWTGRLLQYLRISATDTDGGRAAMVTAEAWQALAVADRGVVDHVWRVGGEDRLVTASLYASLPAGEQGGVRYYRRERPRLAEVEVWTSGPNVALGTLARGGTFTDPNATAFPERAFDGRIATYWDAIVYSTVGDIAGWGDLTVDLGALFRLRAVRPVTGVMFGSGHVLYGYELKGSDGSRAPDGSLIWQALSGDDRLLNQDTRLFEDTFEPREVRYLGFRNVDTARRTLAYEGHRYPSQVSEIQVYAVGYMPEVVMTSGYIDLQRPRSLTTLTWEARMPAGTSVQLRTRTGDELRESTRYFNAQGQELANKEAYDRLPSFARGQKLVEVLPGAGWSGWSQAYQVPGEVVRSPSPRRYLVVEARLRTQVSGSCASLQRLYINFADPVAESVVGEVQPKRDIPLGDEVTLDVFLKPHYVAANPRVDRVRVMAPAGASMSLDQVRLGLPASLAAGVGVTFVPDSQGHYSDSGGQALEVSGNGTDSLTISLPQVLAEGEALDVRLRSAVYQSGATFRAAVGNRARTQVWQEVDAGDAVPDELAPGAGMTVLTPLDGANLKRLGTGPLVLTPNGDGVNETAVVDFAVLRVNGEREVAVSIWDLAGRPVVRMVETRTQATGRYRFVWDGRDDGGWRVPPGVYLLRIEVDTDDRNHPALTQCVHVAY